MGDLSNTIIDGDPFDVHEGGEGGGFDPTSLPVSTNTPADADEIITGENGSWVRKTFAKIKEYFTTYLISTGDNNGQIKVTPSNGTAYNVNVKGLKSAAYLDADTAATANKVVQRNANGYIYGTYINQSSSEESSATNARPCIIDGSGWHRKFSIAAFRNLIGLGNTSGALPVANGGTGATTAANARSNLEIAPTVIALTNFMDSIASWVNKNESRVVVYTGLKLVRLQVMCNQQQYASQWYTVGVVKSAYRPVKSQFGYTNDWTGTCHSAEVQTGGTCRFYHNPARDDAPCFIITYSYA